MKGISWLETKKLVKIKKIEDNVSQLHIPFESQNTEYVIGIHSRMFFVSM